MSGKQCRPWSDTAFFGVWSGSTLVAKIWLSEYVECSSFIKLTPPTTTPFRNHPGFAPVSVDSADGQRSSWSEVRTDRRMRSCRPYVSKVRFRKIVLSYQCMVSVSFCLRHIATVVHSTQLLILVLLNLDMPCLCKQCGSRSVGFWRSQLIWICTVCHSVCEFISTIWIK